MRRFIVVFSILVAVPLVSVSRAQPVHFADANLKAAVEMALGISDPTPTDMLGLTRLFAGSKGIVELTGLEHADNLENLNLAGNEITDISALSGLTRLERLSLYHNDLTDISPLSGLLDLRRLYLYRNNILDISPLSGLTKLERLYLYFNDLIDVSALSGLTNLEYLELTENHIFDISAVSGLTRLIYFRADDNHISDISPLKGLTNLERVNLFRNDISDVSALSGLTRLIDLNLSKNSLSDISALSGLTHLERLYLGKNDISDIVSLTGLQHLSHLDLEENPLGWQACYLHLPIIQDQNPLDKLFRYDPCPSGDAPLFVDDDGPMDPVPCNPSISDPEEDGSIDHPFDSIQEAIDAAADHATVWVKAGRYEERLNFRGRPIHVSGLELSHHDQTPFPVIDANDQGTCVTFDQGEQASCVLSGFVLTRGYGSPAGAIACMGSSPTIRNCLVVGHRCFDPNEADPGLPDPNRAAIYCVDSSSLFENCTIADNYGGTNGAGICVTDCNVVLSNVIVWGNAPQQIQVVSGDGPKVSHVCLDTDPRFVQPGYWVNSHDPNLTVLDPNDPAAIWQGGDYHLHSRGGRYESHTGEWVSDVVTSSCIDRGDSSHAVGLETDRHGDRINLGAYGGTWMASRTPVEASPEASTHHGN